MIKKILFIAIIAAIPIAQGMSPVTVPGGGPIATNLLYVDPAGSDLNAGSAAAPLATIAAAKSAATAGKTVIVNAGNYSITDSILKDGVNWFFAPGAVVTFTNNSADYGPLDDKGAALTCRVSGQGSFVRSESSAGSMSTPSVCSTRNASSDVSVTADSISFSGTQVTGTYGVWGFAGKLTVDVRRIDSSNPNGTTIPIAWNNGAMYVRSHEISSGSTAGGYGIYCNVSAPPTGDCYIEFDSLILPSGITGFGVDVVGTDPTAAMWIRGKTLNPGTTTASRCIRSEATGANKLYLQVEKLYGMMEDQGGTALLYVNTQKWSATVIPNGFASSTGLFAKITGGTWRVKADHMDDNSLSTTNLVYCSAGSFLLMGTDYTAGASTGAQFKANGGILTLKDCTIDVSANNTKTATTVAAGTLNVIACILKSTSTGVDVAQSGGTANVIGCMGSGTAGALVSSGTIAVNK